MANNQQQPFIIDPSTIIVSDNESDLDETIKSEVLLWYQSFKSLKNATRSMIDRSHLNPLLKVPRKELLNVMVNLELMELNTQEKMIMFDLNDSIFTVIYPETYKPMEGEGLLVTSDDPILEKVVAKANRFIQRDSVSMTSPSIAISVLLSKIIEIFITKSFNELTPGVLNATDDVFSVKLEEMEKANSKLRLPSSDDEDEDDDDEEIIQTPTPQRVNISEKNIFDIQEEKDMSELIAKLQKMTQEEEFTMFNNAWGSLAHNHVEYSLSTKGYLLTELKFINTVNGRNGWKIELVDENIYVWTVHLYNFPLSSSIASGLRTFQEKFNIGNGDVVLEIRFGNFPEEPPHIRVVSPRIQYLTGLVQFDGSFCVDFLTRTNWPENKCLSMESIISKLKTSLIENDASIDLRTFKPYDVKAALNSYVRHSRTEVIPIGTKFNEKYYIFSSAFSKRCFDVKVNLKALEKGNKVLLPPEAADKIFNDPNVEFPLTFEIQTKHSRVYCGVSEFTSPSNNIVVPEWMFKSLFITEGAKVNIRCVKLYSATYIKIQPHSKTFYNIENYKQVLESTLSRYSCVTEGQSLQVYDDNDNIHMIEIIETQPSTAVSVISESSNFMEVEIDFVPALDLYDPSELTEIQQQEKQKRLQKKEKTKQDFINKTLQERESKRKSLQELFASITKDTKTVLFKIKFPDGSSVSQKFPITASCSSLYNFVECIQEKDLWKPLPYTTSSELQISTTYPKIDIPSSETLSFETARITGQAAVVVTQEDRFPPDNE